MAYLNLSRLTREWHMFDEILGNEFIDGIRLLPVIVSSAIPEKVRKLSPFSDFQSLFYIGEQLSLMSSSGLQRTLPKDERAPDSQGSSQALASKRQLFRDSHDDHGPPLRRAPSIPGTRQFRSYRRPLPAPSPPASPWLPLWSVA